MGGHQPGTDERSHGKPERRRQADARPAPSRSGLPELARHWPGLVLAALGGLRSRRRSSELTGGEPATGAGLRRTARAQQALLVDMLGRAEGATVDEIVAATGWQPHTVRGAFAGALKKRLGLTIESEKVEGRGRVYRAGAEVWRGRCRTHGRATLAMTKPSRDVAGGLPPHDTRAGSSGVWSCRSDPSLRTRSASTGALRVLPPGAGRGRGAGLASRQRGRGDRPRARGPECGSAAGSAAARLAGATARRAQPRASVHVDVDARYDVAAEWARRRGQMIVR